MSILSLTFTTNLLETNFRNCGFHMDGEDQKLFQKETHEFVEQAEFGESLNANEKQENN